MLSLQSMNTGSKAKLTVPPSLTDQRKSTITASVENKVAMGQVVVNVFQLKKVISQSLRPVQELRPS